MNNEITEKRKLEKMNYARYSKKVRFLDKMTEYMAILILLTIIFLLINKKFLIGIVGGICAILLHGAFNEHVEKLKDKENQRILREKIDCLPINIQEFALDNMQIGDYYLMDQRLMTQLIYRDYDFSIGFPTKNSNMKKTIIKCQLSSIHDKFFKFPYTKFNNLTMYLNEFGYNSKYNTNEDNYVIEINVEELTEKSLLKCLDIYIDYINKHKEEYIAKYMDYTNEIE